MNQTKSFFKIMVLLVFVFLFLVINLGVDYYYLDKRYDALKQKSINSFRQTFPDVQRIIDPVQQMRVKTNELKNSEFSLPELKTDQILLNLLKDISQRVPKSLDVQVGNIMIDSKIVSISGETDTFNSVDHLKNLLEPSDYYSQVTINSANLNRAGKRVQFELKLTRKEY